VTSPNGTTQAALELMASYKLQEAVTNGVKRAAERARELGEQFGGSKA
jgi:pyrroline-5-carboxylate reductase